MCYSIMNHLLFIRGTHISYKMKYWQEYYLAKHKRKHFGRTNISNYACALNYVIIIGRLNVGDFVQ